MFPQKAPMLMSSCADTKLCGLSTFFGCLALPSPALAPDPTPVCKTRVCGRQDAISVIETDCEVDFAPPLDYVEPTRDEYAASAAAAAGAAAAPPPEASASAPSGEVTPSWCWLKHVSARAVYRIVACPAELAAAAWLQPHVLRTRCRPMAAGNAAGKQWQSLPFFCKYT